MSYDRGMSAPHSYPKGWTEEDWLIPTRNEHAIIKHGHSNPKDHSRCGPVLFCCSRAARIYAETYPDMPECNGDWQLIPKDTVLAWLHSGVSAYFFVFCDEDSDDLLAVGIVGEDVGKVIAKEVPLQTFADGAERLSLRPKDDVIFELLDKRS